MVRRIVATEKPTLFFCIPTLFAALLAADLPPDTFASVRLAVSAAEPLPAETWRAFRERFGVEILDGIGSTEALHIFISNRPGKVRPGTSGTPVPGYEARLVDDEGLAIGTDAAGHLEIKGSRLRPATGRTPAQRARPFRESGSARAISTHARKTATTPTRVAATTCCGSAGSGCRPPRWKAS